MTAHFSGEHRGHDTMPLAPLELLYSGIAEPHKRPWSLSEETQQPLGFETGGYKVTAATVELSSE